MGVVAVKGLVVAVEGFVGGVVNGGCVMIWWSRG